MNVGLPCPKGGIIVTYQGLTWTSLPAVPSNSVELVACGCRKNANLPPNVVNIRKSVLPHAGVIHIIVAIPCQIVVADIDRK